MPALCKRNATFWLKIAIFGLGVPLVCLLLLEGALRAVNYGWPTHFFEKQQINGQEYYVSNYKFSWQFFPPRMARVSSPLVIPVHKEPGTIRVFVLGSSAAMGDPEPSFAFSRHLEFMLKQRFPGKKIEVYNTAATAINSNVVLPTARDCLDLEPDLFVLYTGNNEVIGPFGPSGVLAPFLTSRALIKAQIALGQTKTGQLLKTLFTRKNAASPQEWGGMELFLAHKVAYGSPELKAVYSHYHDNLAEICQRAQRKGVKVVLSTLIVNDLDCAPFVSVHKPQLDNVGLEKFDVLYQSGQKFESSQQWPQAIQSYVQAAALDDTYAELQFRLGHCYLRLNQTNEAAQCLAKARDFDALRFRADTHLNEAVRQVAQENPGVLLADAQAAARHSSPNGIPGASLLYEHVHLNFEGNYLLADCVLDQAEKALSLNSSIEKPSVADCKKRFAFTLFEEKRICTTLLDRFSHAPFTSQLSNRSDVKALTNRLADLKAQLVGPVLASTDEFYRNAIASTPDDWGLHQTYMAFLYDSGRYAEALQQARFVYDKIPFAYQSRINVGLMLQKLQKFDEAEDYFNRAIALNPYFAEAYADRASLYEDAKRYDLAEAYYKSRNPAELPKFYNRTGIAYAKERQFDLAITYLNQALSLDPELADAKKNLDACLKRKQEGNSIAGNRKASEFFNEGNNFLRKQDFAKAAEFFKKAIDADPQFAKAYNNLGITLVQIKNYDEAAKQFAEAARLNMPDGAPNLAGVLSLQGKHAEAIEVLQRVVAVQGSRRVYSLMGQEYEKLGKTEEAHKWLEKAQDPSLSQ